MNTSAISQHCFYRGINPKPVLICAFGVRALSPILCDNPYLRPFLVEQGITILNDGVPFTRDVSHFLPSQFRFSQGSGLESLKRFLRSNAEDYKSVLCLFLDVSPPEPFPVLCNAVPVTAFHFSSETGAYRQIFPPVSPCCPVKDDEYPCISARLRRNFVREFFV